MVECRDYYFYYKKTIYVEEDKKHTSNWINLGNAFTSDLNFFKRNGNFILGL